jgi:hypothetical protein
MLFTEKLFVLKYSFIFIVLAQDTSSPGSMAGQIRGSRNSVKFRSLTVCNGQYGKYTLSKIKVQSHD